jgi:fused signal recognition particle receptor
MQKKGLFQKLFGLFAGAGNEEAFEGIEDLLIEADLGYKTATALTAELRQNAKAGKLKSRQELFDALKAILRPMVLVKPLEFRPDALNLYLFLGVNGVGKTTSLAKLAFWLVAQGRGPVVLAAGDTFRAAAAEQLQLHGQRQNLRVVAQKHGADPGAVLYDALDSARAHGDKVVLADTAGRLHNKANLVKELQKIDKIAREKLAGGVYQKILVLDATTGQNAFQQAQVFHEAVGVDAVVLSKYDSSGKGGIVVAVSRELGLPFAFFGTGEKPHDFQAFDVETFLDGLLGEP